jgi:hypothetical protein
VTREVSSSEGTASSAIWRSHSLRNCRLMRAHGFTSSNVTFTTTLWILAESGAIERPTVFAGWLYFMQVHSVLLYRISNGNLCLGGI